MANTVIQLKYSSVTSAPATLQVGEPAYSFSSDKLFIGNTTTGVITIGGKYYTDIVDAATSSNTVSTIVKRDASGNFSAGTITATLNGNAATATKWASARDLGLSGDLTGNVSIDGSQNVTLVAELTDTGVTANTYGGSATIPVFTVDVDGRITAASNVAISIPTALNIAADTGTNVVTLSTDTLTFVGGDGITTSIGPTDNVKIDVDGTVVRTTGGTISGSLTVTGNLVVLGNTVTQNVETLAVEDSLIQLAVNNLGDGVDIGFFGQYVNGGTKYTTLFRDASDSGKFKLLTDGTELPSAGNTVNVAAFTRATLDANITGGTVSGLSADISVADGGTGASSFTAGGILMGNGTGAISVLANSTFTATNLGSANTINSVTVDAYGRTTAVSTTPIAIGAGQITSGTLPIARGGTNQTAFTTGQRVLFNGTSLTSMANSSVTATGTLTTANTITSVTVDNYGQLTAYTSQAIAIAASQITSGTLGVARGGTGLASYAVGDLIYASGATTLASLADVATGNVLISGGVTTAPAWGKVGLTTHVTGTLGVVNGGTGVSTITNNGVVLGQGTNPITTASSSTEGHILTINSSGVPTFMMLSGGTF